MEDRNRYKGSYRTPDSTEKKLYDILTALKKATAHAAKSYKQSRRAPGTSKEQLTKQYNSTLDAIIAVLEKDMQRFLIPYARSEDGPKVGHKTVERVIEEVWKPRFLKARKVVDRALHNTWGGETAKLKRHMRQKLPVDDTYSGVDWGKIVDDDTMELKYGGSLARGWKGPPKQAVAMTPYAFDVDANLTSNSIAMRLLSNAAEVDRGQIRPTRDQKEDVGLDTAEKNLDVAIKKELGRELKMPSLFPADLNEKGVTKECSNETEIRYGSTYLTEPFEVFVNVDSKVIKDEYKGVPERAKREQQVRDMFTAANLAESDEKRKKFKIAVTMVFGGGNRGPFGERASAPTIAPGGLVLGDIHKDVDLWGTVADGVGGVTDIGPLACVNDRPEYQDIFSYLPDCVICPPTVSDIRFSILPGSLSDADMKKIEDIISIMMLGDGK